MTGCNAYLDGLLDGLASQMGVKVASHIIQAAELLTTAQNMSRSKGQQLAAAALECGLWYLMVFVFHW
jgi:hypothetical protein